MSERVLTQRIYLDEHAPEYLVLLPMVPNFRAFTGEAMPIKQPMVVAVYEYRGGNMDTSIGKYRYDFIGVRIQ